MAVHPVKISRPRISRAFLREQHFQKLDQALEASVAVVVGPPGSGKTTLLSTYIDSRQVRCIWYQVDQGDEDVVTLFHYLNLAAKKSAPRTKQTLPLLSQPFRPELKVYARRYFEELCQRLKPPFLFVFDNYQNVPEDALFHEIVRDGLATLPPGFNSILLSRTPPPPVYASLRASKQLTQLEGDFLTFSQEETATMVQTQQGKNASPTSSEQLHNITQGWAAGIVLLMEQLNSPRSVPPPIGSDKLQHVFDYFAGELFSNMSDTLKTTLLKASFMDEMNPHTLKKITGIANSGKLLGELADRNYFTTRHTSNNKSYQFHPLFKDFLQHRLTEQYSPKQVKSLQRKTALTLAENKQTEPAVKLLIDAQDWHVLAPMVIDQASYLMAQGRFLTLQKWLSHIPQHIQQQYPWLLYWYGNCRLVTDTDLSLDLFEEGFKYFVKQDDAKGLFSCYCGILESILFSFSNYQRLDYWIDLFPQLREKYNRLPTIELSARISADMHTALWFHQPDHPDLPIWERRVVNLMRQLKITLNSHHRVLVGINLFYQHLWRGDFRQSKVLIDTLSPKQLFNDTNAVSQLAWYAIFCLYQWLNAEQESCINTVEEGLKIAEASGVHFWSNVLIAQGAHASLNIGDISKAEHYLKCMRDAEDENKQLEMGIIYDFSAQLACYKGQYTDAVKAAETAVFYGELAGMVFPLGCFRMGYAEVLYESGEIESALEQIRLSKKLANEMQSKIILFRLQLLEATIAQNQGDLIKTKKILAVTLAMGRINNYVNCFWWRPSVLIPLLYTALEANIEVLYVCRLIRLRNLNPIEHTPPIDTWPYAVRISTLGDFSIEVKGKALALSGKAQKRPLELLKLLISMGDREVSQEIILSSLWPNSSGEGGTQTLYTTVHRLRKLLCCESAIILKDSRLKLNKQVVWLDVWTLFTVQKGIDTLLSYDIVDNQALYRLHNKIYNLYQGDFLNHEADSAWSFSCRDTIKRRVLHSLTLLGKHWESENRNDEALYCFQKALDIDPLAEEFYQHLMLNYLQQGRSADAAITFLRCRKALSTSLGVTPSNETIAINNSIQKTPSF